MSQPPHFSTTSTLRKTLSITEDNYIQNSFPAKNTPVLSKSIEPRRERRRKRQNPEVCNTDLPEGLGVDEDSLMSSSDVETFQGKIVYNLDANSAYIIDNDEDESLVPLKEDSGSGHSKSVTPVSKSNLLTFSVRSDSSSASKLRTSSKLAKILCTDPDTSSSLSRAPTPTVCASSNPKVHSFRVVSAHDAIVSASQRNPDESSITKKIQKPILMCFICKFSFGNAKSFSSHASVEHSLNLQDLELECSLLKREYSSAIIQRNMDEKPQISFLEPLDDEDTESEHKKLEVKCVRPEKPSEDDTQSHADHQSISSHGSIGTTPSVNSENHTATNPVSSFVSEIHSKNVPSGDVSSLLSAESTFGCITISSPKMLCKETLPREVDYRESGQTFHSPKRCISPHDLVENEMDNSIATSNIRSDAHSTDILSSNKIEAVDECSEKSTRGERVIDQADGKQQICGSSSPSSNAGRISAAVADFLQQQLQQLTSPLRNMQSDFSPSSTASTTVAKATIVDSSPYSLSMTPTTTLATAPSLHEQNLDCLQLSIGALSCDKSTNSVQFLNELLLKHQQAMQQQHNQQHSTCFDHPDLDGIDCKTCEIHKHLKFLKQQKARIPPQTTPVTLTSSVGGCSNTSTSVSSNICSLSPNVTSSIPANNNVSSTPIVSAAPSFTIGACSEHINGRPLGVDCVRCEMILTSARLNSGVQISSTRNSCKTLKCPQCNWHYKYQETLEIHMREKHPDGESACGYCLAGQQHPRLARGESYSCGYKPYRCEICNYSTTTKGNLSIHMQSDKHLNNMQELNNSQNMVAAAAAAAAVAAAASSNGNKIGNEGNSSSGNASKSLMQSNNVAGTQQTLQQPISAGSSIGGSVSSANNMSSPSSNKPRPSFRCDICSYETSVARNLRIHMTSEKHTHNMAVLQNNIKHIQAFSFLQQQHQQATAAVAAAAVAAANSSITPHIQGSSLSNSLGNIGAGSSMSSGDNSPFLPEVALADMAYNQALMIQLLQQNVAAVAAAQQQQQIICKSPNKISQTSPTTQTLQSQQQQRNSPVNKSPIMMFPEMNGSDMSLSSSISGLDPLNEKDMTAYEKPDFFPTTLFSCLVCSVFNSNNLDELQQHLLLDRSRNSTSSHDIMILHNSNYICRLCNYKTNLKANFQLHSKTDKHLQKLNFINHIREGGPRNEYKLEFQQQQQFATNTVQLKCNCCDFYTNSIQKLSLHVQHMRHETMRTVFQHLRYLLINNGNASADSSGPSLTGEVASTDSPSCDLTPDGLERQVRIGGSERIKVLYCQLCNFVAASLLDMIRHVKSLRHLQVEQFICLQRRSENLDGPSLEDIFKLNEQDQQVHEETSFTDQGPDSNDDNSFKLKHNTLASSSTFTEICPSQLPSMRLSMDEIMSASSINEEVSEGNIRSPISCLSLFPGESVHDRKPLSLDCSESESAVIYKCNNSSCEFLSQTKSDLELHHEEAHHNCELNFITIPTNSAAIQAFQAAVAAATAAAAAAASCFAGKHNSAIFSSQEDDDCQIAIKRERLDFDQIEMEEANIKVRESENQAKSARDVTSVNTTKEHLNLKPAVTKAEEEMVPKIQCPLCQDSFTEKSSLEYHLTKVHSVSQDGLMRLLQLVDKIGWQCSPKMTGNSAEEIHGDSLSELKMPTQPISSDSKEENFCQQCRIGFESEQLLLQHAQKSQHFTIQESGECLCLALDSNHRSCNLSFPSLPAMLAHYRSMHIRNNDGSACSSNLVISERHVYKYRCKQCSLAFKTEAKLNTHAIYHTMRDATKCNQCQRNFRSTQALQKHMEQSHANKPSVTILADQTLNDSGKGFENIGSSAESKKSSHKSPSPLFPYAQPGNVLNSTENERTASPTNQQHQVAAVTAALLKQQQHFGSGNLERTGSSSPLTAHSLEILQSTQAENILKLDAAEQQQRVSGFADLQSLQNLQSFQGLQSLQQMQHHLPQLAAAAAASSLHMNPVDMLNLMQFHHLMSLNFMNLAPPLIFGGNTTTATSTGNSANAASRSPNAAALSIATCSDISQHPSSMTPTTQASGATVLESASQLHQHQQKQQTSPGIAAAQLSTNQKRARTRITDEQLKILRAHFDINNSPSEESIMEMSDKANLPMKVVKHWFRNTLFKERQRNKDSPYNFNNPPSTTLNLEEYERTGQAKVTSLNENLTATIAASSTEAKVSSEESETHQSIPTITDCSAMSCQSNSLTLSNDVKQVLKSKECLGDNTFLNVDIKTEPGDEMITNCSNSAEIDKGLQEQQEQQLMASTTALAMLKKHQQRLSDILSEQDRDLEQAQQAHEQMHHPNRPPIGTSPAIFSQMQSAVQQAYYNSYDAKSESGSSDILSRPPTPNSASAIAMHSYSNINDLLSQQLESMPSTNTQGSSQMGPPKNFQLTPSSGSSGKHACGGNSFEKNSPSSQFDTNSNSSTGSSTSSGKRANRTRFTDYQIKVLQEFFENNSYPKDSDLEYLSKLLLLSPRVIVVWFQNARQKQRKIYENQPNNSLYETEEKKQNINYACKKCNLVFQRYYELIRHQKNHCFKEENNKKSAKAQIAAAQIAQNLSSEDSNSSMDHQHQAAAAAAVAAAAVASSGAGSSIASSIISGNGFNLVPNSPQYQAFNKSTSLMDSFSPSTTPTPPSQQRERRNSIEQKNVQSPPVKHHKHECDKCKLTFTHLEHLREHQLLHIVNPGMFTIGSPLQTQNSQTHSMMDTSSTVYGPFGSILQNLQQAVQQQQQHQHLTKKRKYSETSSNADDQSSIGGMSSSTGDLDVQAKRYEFLYQYFMQNESNSEVRQQFQNQRLSQSHDVETDIEFLMSYYQQCEMKRRSSHEFLLQYYTKNEQSHISPMSLDGETKPTFDFLLQYYQLHESKKFFQLDASPQPLDPDESPSRYRKLQDFEKHRETLKSSEHPLNIGESNENTTENLYSFFRMNDTVSNVVETSSSGKKNHKSIEVNDVQAKSVNCKNSTGSEENYNINENRPFYEECKEKRDQTKKDNQQFFCANVKSPLATKTGASEKIDLQYQNLEDFLDVTMIENNSQSLALNEISSSSQNSQTMIETDEKNKTALSSVKPSSSSECKQNKRLRTTILPDQLNFLYECYQNESNPSRKMLEEIAKKVNLKKRVVQVWFQNARAKDKKSRNQRYMPQIPDDSDSTILKATQATKDTTESTIVDYKFQLTDLNAQPCNLMTSQAKELIFKCEEMNSSSIGSDLRHENNDVNDNGADLSKNIEITHFDCESSRKGAENFLNIHTLKEFVKQQREQNDFYINSYKKSTDIDNSIYNNHTVLKQHKQGMLINFNADSGDTENDGDDISRNICNGNEVRNHNGNNIMKQMFKFNQITGLWFF